MPHSLLWRKGSSPACRAAACVLAALDAAVSVWHSGTPEMGVSTIVMPSLFRVGLGMQKY